MLIIDIVNYSLAAILIGVTVSWIILLRSMLESFRLTPHLDAFEKTDSSSPLVSIILPARNEEKFIGRCLDSLINQEYEDYEIIAIDDSSSDNTKKIIKEYEQKSDKVVHVSAGQKPEGWMGKNWACIEGYRRASGGLLLFTDSDTKHASNVVSLAVGHMQSLKLDALTAIPRMRSLDFWTRITLPVISTFLHTRFSALRVNDPTKSTGYFFGSFFIIKKEAYERVGTHEGVKHEIIEDGALGKKVKESGFRMKMVRGDKLIDAVWARDGWTLWNALKRLMIPLFWQCRATAIGIFFAVLFLLFMPFPMLAYSAAFLNGSSTYLLLAASIASSTMIYAGAIVETTKGLCMKSRYAFLCPLGGLVVVSSFLSGLIHVRSDAAVSWRDRRYSIRDHAQNAVNI